MVLQWPLSQGDITMLILHFPEVFLPGSLSRERTRISEHSWQEYRGQVFKNVQAAVDKSIKKDDYGQELSSEMILARVAR